MLAYDFGPKHPLRPIRLSRAIELAARMGFEAADPGPGDVQDVLRVHDPDFVDYVRKRSVQDEVEDRFRFGSLDNPAFEGMYEASLAYVAGTVAATRAVVAGAPLAISLSGGLHHARRSEASGFCVFNDPAIAVALLLESFGRVAYVDIDVHHGDGVQWLHYDNPRVMTCSIHQDGRTLYPGTGSVEETGAACTSINVPLPPGTTGDVWLEGFERVIMEALRRFQPDAVVLQMGTDAHSSDPLARLQITAQEWLSAVRRVKGLGLPTVAVGGGGYHVGTVPRLWVGACLTLEGRDVPETLPEDLGAAWGEPTFLDASLPEPRDQGRDQLDVVVHWHERITLPEISPR